MVENEFLHVSTLHNGVNDHIQAITVAQTFIYRAKYMNFMVIII